MSLVTKGQPVSETRMASTHMKRFGGGAIEVHTTILKRAEAYLEGVIGRRTEMHKGIFLIYAGGKRETGQQIFEVEENGKAVGMMAVCERKRTAELITPKGIKVNISLDTFGNVNAMTAEYVPPNSKADNGS